MLFDSKMGLDAYSNIIQTKNALTQYITIPSTMVADSQYPFRDAGKIKITIKPDEQMMIITREDIKPIPSKDVSITHTPDGALIIKVKEKEKPKLAGHADLHCVVYIRQPTDKVE